MPLAQRLSCVILFHLSGYRFFKYFYEYFVKQQYAECFPESLSYTRFVALMPRLMMPLMVYLHVLGGDKNGIYYVDSSKLEVCHLKRTKSNKVFAHLARLGKTSTGWFYGFKLHLVVNDKGQFIALKITPGNVDDRAVVPSLLKGLKGSVYADKGYVSSKLAALLLKQAMRIITYIRKNMRAKLFRLFDFIRLRKRNLIENIFNILKGNMNLQHTRHRSINNFFVNLFAALVAYAVRNNSHNSHRYNNFSHQFLIQN